MSVPKLHSGMHDLLCPSTSLCHHHHSGTLETPGLPLGLQQGFCDLFLGQDAWKGSYQMNLFALGNLTLLFCMISLTATIC